jgi:serine/threonine protein kinase
MMLIKGARKAFVWLTGKAAGVVVDGAELRAATEWSDVSLTTYIGKNKLAPFLQPLGNDKFKVLMDGKNISDQYFYETFTQKGPRKITLVAGDQLTGTHASYDLVEPLGNGAVGHVWSARLRADSDPQLVAAKIMLPREDLLDVSKLTNVRERFRREGSYGMQLKHPHVVRYIDLGDVQGNPFLVMELAEASIGSFLRDGDKLEESDTDSIVACCLDGLDYLHSHGAPHRDVKPDNILKFGDTYKLGDLGIVKWGDFDPVMTRGGTITRASMQLGSWFYMAPEQQQDPHEACNASDIYALGISWIEMLTGAVPAPQAIGSNAYPVPSERPEVNEIIKRMVSYDAKLRPTSKEIRKAIHR